MKCPHCKQTIRNLLPKVRTKPRRGPMRDPKYRRWLREQLCAAPGDYFEDHSLSVDPAHTQNNGMRSKDPDSSCAPLCRARHREYEAGRAAFEAKYGIDMRQIAAEHYFRYLNEARKDN